MLWHSFHYSDDYTDKDAFFLTASTLPTAVGVPRAALPLAARALSPAISRAAWNAMSVAVSAVSGKARRLAHHFPNISRSARYAARVFGEVCELSQPSTAACWRAAVLLRLDAFGAMRR